MPAYEGGTWSRYSPGRLLLEHLFEWCFANEIEVFDFGIGDEPYKLEFYDQILALYQRILPVTLPGYAYGAALRARQIAKDTRLWLKQRDFKRLKTSRTPSEFL
jgi:CelD/BcsL family acetyltransferase involved in cellulose biosynthesis